MASREMIDVLQRLRELDEKNPNVHTDALENTEKLNPPVEEAKKKMVKDPKTGKMVPDYAIDGKGKDDLKKENVKESITISADSPEDLPVIAQIMKLAGMQAVTPDMMPDVDNVPAMKADDNINGSPCGCDDDSDNAVITKTDKGVDFDLDRDGAPDMAFDNAPDEAYQGVDAVTTNAGTDGLNGTNHPQDIRVKDASPYAGYEQRLAKLAGIENEEMNEAMVSLDKGREYFFDKHDFADENIASEFNKLASKMSPEDAETLKKELEEFYPDVDLGEGYANSMGNEKEEPTYKGYDPDYSDHTEDGKPKVRYVPSRYGDNPLESIENNLKAEYEKFKK